MDIRDTTIFRRSCGALLRRNSQIGWFALLLFAFCVLPVAGVSAQTVNQYTNTTAGAITDLSCNQPITSQIVRTFTVSKNFTVRDVNIGIFLNHTYRSDLRIFLTSPANTVATVMTWTGNVQAGDNLNDLFDDEAAAAIGTHVASAIDPVTPLPPAYSHSFRPSTTFTAFDGQNASGDWTLRICDAVGTDTGSFTRADLYIMQPVLQVTKTSNVVTDNISGTNPKAIPGSIIRYCVLMTNTDSIAMSNIAPSDTLPANTAYLPGTLRSGTSCANATNVEDDDNSDAGETDPFRMGISGSTITGSAATLAASASFAMVFDVVVN